VFLVRVESSTDPTGSPPRFALARGGGLGLLDVDWHPGEWATPWEDGYAIAGFPEAEPRAGLEVWVRVDWFPVRPVPALP